MTPHILVLDDEPQILRLVRNALVAQGYGVVTADTGEQAVRQLDSLRPDMVILDLGLPGMSGFEVCREVRARTGCPILVLSGWFRESDKVTALDHGADDYLTKPFGMDELLARVRAHLRRWRDAPQDLPLRAGDLVFDFVNRTVSRGGEPLKFTPTEYEVLRLLARNAGRVMTYNLILQLLRGVDCDEDVNMLRVHVASIRKKIEENPTQPRYLITEIGVGYRFVLPEPPLDGSVEEP
jgi:two-component system, OmpR family, KDP operon response regulator KdpE